MRIEDLRAVVPSVPGRVYQGHYPETRPVTRAEVIEALGGFGLTLHSFDGGMWQFHAWDEGDDGRPSHWGIVEEEDA